jgi:hypothetical protein
LVGLAYGRDMTNDWWRLVLVVVAVGTGIALSVVHGVPAEMPVTSLGWPLLLHLERSVALLGVAIAALLMGVRATMGRFPTKFAQIEYPNSIDRRDSLVTQTHEERLLFIERMLEIVPDESDSRRKQI